jgi:peroxiredoxin
MAIAARRMGYRVHTYSPAEETPTGQVADLEIAAEYEDLEAIRLFAKGVDVVTFEFENVPTEAADAAAEIVPVRPSSAALHITQQRAREKGFLADRGLPAAACAAVATLDELAEALGQIGVPAIVKTAVFGYDGNGEFTRKMGMLVDKSNVGFGMRSWRYSMLVDDCKIEKIFVETDFGDNCPIDPFEVSDADTMMAYLKGTKSEGVSAPVKAFEG